MDASIDLVIRITPATETVFSVPDVPSNGYVTEDGSTFYVAEDGATYYVQEN